MRHALAGTEMRQALVGVLSVIAANQGGVGRAMGMQRFIMASLVNQQVEAGLVMRETAADDRRAFALTLTPAGEEKDRSSLAIICAHEDQLLVALSTAGRAQLIDLLAQIEAVET